MAETWGLNSTLMCRSLHAADYDKDGFTDLYVVNINNSITSSKTMGSRFHGRHGQTGTFDTGVGMGSIFFDYDNDGDQDLYLTHDANQTNKLYRNNGEGAFNDFAFFSGLITRAIAWGSTWRTSTTTAGLTSTSPPLPQCHVPQRMRWHLPRHQCALRTSDSGMTWGCVFFDYDHDGEWDLYIISITGRTSANILSGNGDNTFTPVSGGDATLEHTYSDYGLAMGDLDRTEIWTWSLPPQKRAHSQALAC